jgi:hypothetical protein
MRDLERDYRAHGAEAIARIRKNDPRHYLRLLSLASRVANTARKPFEDLCDEELANLIQSARAAFASTPIRRPTIALMRQGVLCLLVLPACL